MGKVLNVLRWVGAVVVALMVSAVVVLGMAVVGLVAVVWRALPWVVGAAALAVLVLRALEVAGSEEGLWPSRECIGGGAM